MSSSPDGPDSGEGAAARLDSGDSDRLKQSIRENAELRQQVARLQAAAGGGAADADDLRAQVARLKVENAELREQAQRAGDKVEEHRRAAKRKVAELEGLLRHVSEELAQNGDADGLRMELVQAKEDMARLEEELNNTERRHQRVVSQLEADLKLARSNAGGSSTSSEVATLKKEKAAFEIVMNQLSEELEQERAARTGGSGRGGASVGGMGSSPAMIAAAAAAGQPIGLDALNRTHAESMAAQSRASEIEHKLRTTEYEVQKLTHELTHAQMTHTAEVQRMQGEHLAHVKELQAEIAHVCNVLAAVRSPLPSTVVICSLTCCGVFDADGGEVQDPGGDTGRSGCDERRSRRDRDTALHCSQPRSRDRAARACGAAASGGAGSRKGENRAV